MRKSRFVVFVAFIVSYTIGGLCVVLGVVGLVTWAMAR